MPGRDPGIQAAIERRHDVAREMDRRVKPGDDNQEARR
jgi:hypothetical protein